MLNNNQRHESAIRSYRSDVIPDRYFIHGFPERYGGVSTGLRASLNVGTKWGDDPLNVEENLRRIASISHFSLESLVVTRHVHGTRVWRVGSLDRQPSEYDGLTCADPRKVLAAFGADCIPMLFASPDAGTFAVAHAGWRGTVGDIAGAVVADLGAMGTPAESLYVALGPSIGPCCFEVGHDVAATFTGAFRGARGVVVDGPTKPHIDLRLATRLRLVAAGVRSESIDDRPPCTKCNPDRFFSYRRDGNESGCHLGFIGVRQSSC